MEWLNSIWQQVALYVSVPYLVIFMLLSYFVKKYFGVWLSKITKAKWQNVYTVLIIATVTAIPFLIFSKETWVQILFSYALGTSLHELIFNWIEEKFSKK
jgi:hypothetical protein